MAPSPCCLVWFRQDLRVADNPALIAAAKTGLPIIALYILDDDNAGRWAIGGAGKWWLHRSLESLSKMLGDLGIPLVLRRGSAKAILPVLVTDTGVRQVFWNRLYEPAAIARDTAIKAALTGMGVKAESFNGSLIVEPWTMKTQAGEPFKVFTPFWRAMRGAGDPSKPQALPAIKFEKIPAPSGDTLNDWGLLPSKPDWATGFAQDWMPGEDGARIKLDRFLDHGAAHYREGRNFPGAEHVSRLSPHLHWGEISPRYVWHSAESRVGPVAEPFLRELAWREFSYHLLWQFPDLPEQPFSGRFAAFPWLNDPAGLKAWQRGLTGYPFVDAGMRQLWATGWMHNRVRMAAASFLIKHLLIDWRAGQDWFWDTLVDADLANNAASWQWVAGSGADAAPYFRIFNPVLQGEKFDADGVYVRRWVPELARLPDEWLHKPWMAPADILADAGVVLGKTYPAPIVDHTIARNRALAALAEIKA